MIRRCLCMSVVLSLLVLPAMSCKADPCGGPGPGGMPGFCGGNGPCAMPDPSAPPMAPEMCCPDRNAGPMPVPPVCRKEEEGRGCRMGIPCCRMGKCGGGRPGHPAACLFLAMGFLVHILLTVWVYQDIRRRNTGSGLWVVITLLSGFFGALLYALVRLGDQKE